MTPTWIDWKSAGGRVQSIAMDALVDGTPAGSEVQIHGYLSNALDRYLVWSAFVQIETRRSRRFCAAGKRPAKSASRSRFEGTRQSVKPPPNLKPPPGTVALKVFIAASTAQSIEWVGRKLMHCGGSRAVPAGLLGSHCRLPPIVPSQI